jgi:hypothetical protein
MQAGTGYWDDTNDVIVAVIHYDGLGTQEHVTLYMAYSYDDNDQFTYGSSTATTMATWEAFLRAYHTNGTYSYSLGTGSSGLMGVDYEVLSTGISVFTTM